jgi:hypothetical protein
VLAVIFAPREIAAVALFEALDRTASRLVTFGGGREADRQIV